MAGYLGLMAARQSLERHTSIWYLGGFDWLRRGLRRIATGLAALSLRAVYWATRYEQPEPLLPSPFAGLLQLVCGEAPERPAFMLHAGDQIYYDFPFPKRTPLLAEYRRAYRRAWSEDAVLAQLLAQCPHYMCLDDHEIVDRFANDEPRS